MKFKNWTVYPGNPIKLQYDHSYAFIAFTKNGLRKFSAVMEWLRIHNIDPKEFNEFLIQNTENLEL